MSSPSIGSLTFDTMDPHIQTAQAQWIDQTSTGRDGTDSVLDAFRAPVQTITTVKLTDGFASAVSGREGQKALMLPGENIVSITDDSGTTYADTLIRGCRPVAIAQADGTGMIITEWDIRIKTVRPTPTPPPPEPEP